MYLQVDLYEVGDEVIVEAEVPGIAPTDIELEVSSDCVRIGGRRTRRCRTISPDIPMRSHRRERSLGDFCLEIPLAPTRTAGYRTRHALQRRAHHQDAETKAYGHSAAATHQARRATRREGGGVADRGGELTRARSPVLKFLWKGFFELTD